MPRFAAFLRGINVGGRRVTGDRLCAPVVAMGATDVASFLASGNLVFELTDRVGEDAATEPAGDRRLERRLEERFAEALGFEVPTFVRSAEEIRAIASHQPFDDDLVARTRGSVQVALLRSAPGPTDAATALGFATEGDALALHGRELYWLPSSGISDSALDLDALARVLGETTVRTSNTIRRIHTRFFGGS